MDLRQIADAIGIGAYDPALDAVLAALPDADNPACDLELIDSLQTEWDLFGEYYEIVKSVAEQINGDRNRRIWINVAVAYAMDQDVTGARKVAVPKADGTAVTAMLPLYILIPMVPVAVKDYRRRGFSEQEIKKLMYGFQDGIRLVKLHNGMPGVDAVYYHWLMLFAKAMIFQNDGLQFELRQLPGDMVYIKNKCTHQVIGLRNGGMVHRSGQAILGSVCYEDAQGAFEAAFHEDNRNIYGHPCTGAVIETEEKVFPKNQWEVVIRPGDDCLSIHIPRGVDISVETMEEHFVYGRMVAAQRYPEYKPVAFYGYSWILNPKLVQIVGPDSKIAGLLDLFIKSPQKSDGNSVFSFVFDRKPDRYEDLPEDSRLRRGLKNLYLNGDCIHPYAGIVLR